MTGVGADVLVRLPELDSVVGGTFVHGSERSRARECERKRTCEELRAIDSKDGPDGLLVSNKVVQQLEVLPHLCRSSDA